MGAKSKKGKAKVLKVSSLGPETVEQMCDDCEMRGVDYTRWPSRDTESLANFVLGKMINGVSPDKIPNMAYDPDSGFDVPLPSIPAAKACAARIVAGECVNYGVPPALQTGE